MYEKTTALQKADISYVLGDVLNITKPGTFHIRVKCKDTKAHRGIYSNWIEIVCRGDYRSFGRTDNDNNNDNNDNDNENEDSPEEGGIREYIVTGGYTGVVGSDPVSLDEVITVDPLLEDTESGDGHSWQAREEDGITIIAPDKVIFTKPGTYHVRLLSDKCVVLSDWAEITAVMPEPEPEPENVIKPIAVPAPQGGGSTVSLSVSGGTSASPIAAERTSLVDGKKIAYTIGSDGSIVLTWDKVAKAKSYTVYLIRGSKSKMLTETTDTTYTYTGARPGSTYEFMVKYTTKDRAGLSRAGESYRIAVILTSAGKPAVRASAKDGKVTLKWDAVDGADKYAVYRYTDGKLKKVTTTAKTAVRMKQEPSDKGYAVKAHVDGKWTTVKKSDIVTAD